MGAFLRKYATATTVYFPLISYNSVSFSSTATLTTADMKISVDGAAFTTSSVGIVNVGSFGYSYTCRAGSEMTGKISIFVIRHTAATPTFEDQSFIIETYGNASAQHPFDLSTANQTVIASAGTVMLAANALSAGAVVAGAFSAGAFAAGFISAGGIAANAISAGGIATGAIDSDSIAAGAITSNGFPANFSALSITAVTGLVSISTAASVIAGTVSDKTGYSLTQTFPSNFADLSITAATGLVSVSTAASVNCGTISAAAVTSIWAVAAVEPTGAPTITSTFRNAISWLLALSRNKITQTSTLQTLFSDTTTVTISASTLADDATVFTRSQWTV